MMWFVDASAWDNPFRPSLVIARDRGNGRVAYVAPFSFIEKGESERVGPEETAFSLGGRGEVTALMQAMLDAAWSIGLRPSKGPDKSHEAHLADMRRIAFHVLKIEGK